MGVYLRDKCEVSSVILTGFRQGVGIIPPLSSQNEPLKSPPRLGLTLLSSVNFLGTTNKTNINDTNAKMCALDFVKDLNVKVFNLILE